jgi:arylsulfatase A-like enzyme
MWEHGQGCDHGCSLFEEEIRVPLWIDAPASTLSPAEAEALASAKNEPVFHVDAAATLLDLLGLWDAPELGDRRRFFLGQPLTRPGRELRTIPLSNVSHGWERGLPSYGLMRGPMKLAAMHRHGRFVCHDVEHDPSEEHDLEGDCKDLRDMARAVYGVPPSAFGNLSQHPSWGPFVP